MRLPLAYLVLACVLGGAASIIGIYHYHLWSSTVVTEAVVASSRTVTRGTGQDHRTTSYPTVQFRTSDGREIRAEVIVGSDAYSFRDGRQVAVRYAVASPTRVWVDDFWGFWAIPLAAVVLLGVAGMRALISGTIRWLRYVQS